MALTPVNGTQLAIATAFGTAANINTISNAAAAIAAMASGHGLTTGDLVIYAGGWTRMNNQVFRVTVSSDNVTLQGANTTSTDRFPVGAGVGTLRKITTWTPLGVVLNIAPQGGEQQFWNYQDVAEDDERQMPTNRSASSVQFQLLDDITQAGYAAALDADDNASVVPIRFVFKTGGRLLCNGFWSVGRWPTLESNTGKRRTVTFTPQAPVTEYST